MFKRILADAILIAFASVLLAQFILVWVYGWILVGEPNLVIRASETLMCIAIVILGFICLRADMKACKAKATSRRRRRPHQHLPLSSTSNLRSGDRYLIK